MADRRFELVCEIEPPTRPDLTRVRHQIGVLSLAADSFLIPDNHIGRATVSSVAVAHEVQAMGARGIACLNSRDRNLLGFRRDLLTAAAYGVDRFLFVYGDKPTVGGRTSELTVRAMMDEARGAAGIPALPAAAVRRRGHVRPAPGTRMEGCSRLHLRAGQFLSRCPAAVAGEHQRAGAGLCGGDGAGQRGHGPQAGVRYPGHRHPRPADR